MDDEFLKIKNEYFEKREKYLNICKEKEKINKELKILQSKFQSICKHEFRREETTSGCYRECHDICKICNYWR